jgi:hypothetical protein
MELLNGIYYFDVLTIDGVDCVRIIEPTGGRDISEFPRNEVCVPLHGRDPKRAAMNLLRGIRLTRENEKRFGKNPTITLA